MRPARRNRRELPPGPNWIRGATSIRIDVPSVEIPPEDDGRATDEVPRSKLVSLSARFQGYHLGSPDSLPPIDEDAPPIPATLFRSNAEARRPHSPPPSRAAPVSDLDDAQSGELSTGLFESLDWDEAPPPKVDRPERALEPRVKREPVYVRNAIVDLAEQETLPPTATQVVVAAQTDAFVREALAADWWVDADADPEELDREWNGVREPLAELDLDPELDTAVGAAPPSALASPPPTPVLSRVFPEPLALDDDELSLDPEPLDQAIHRAIDRAAAAQARDEARAREAERAAREAQAEAEAEAEAEARAAALAEAVEIDARATPASPEPRPERDSVVDWPPPMDRPAIDYPADWNPRTDDWGTMIVIQPRGAVRQATIGGPWMVDLAAWSLGFLAMFFTGLVTTGSALLVLFALSLP